jgi:hypothetical protein
MTETSTITHPLQEGLSLLTPLGIQLQHFFQAQNRSVLPRFPYSKHPLHDFSLWREFLDALLILRHLI